MSFRLSSLRVFPSLIVASAGLLAIAASGADRERGRSIEFSESRSAETLTNLNQLTTKKDGLKQLEEDLYRPLQSMTPKSSLDGFFDPPQQQRHRVVSKAEARRAKEQSDRQRNWIFLDPDDGSAGPTAESIFNIPQFDADGQEKKKLSVFEQYLENQEKKQTEKNKDAKTKAEEILNRDKDSDSRDQLGSHGDRKESNAFGDREQALRRLFGKDSGIGSQPVMRGSLSDIFGLGEKPPSAEDIARHKASMEEFRSILNSGWQPPADSFKSSSSFSDPSKSTFSTPPAWDSLPGSVRKDNSSSFAGAAPAFNSAPAQNPFSDFSAKSAATPTVTPSPKPQTPSFTAPRRVF